MEKQQFRFMLESLLNILDDVLQEELSRASDSKLKTIVATIQRDQNAIIRNEDAHTMIIQGAAGSGKTSIAMHCIAYLLYKHKDTIRSQDILTISPNNVFVHYISQVLPELMLYIAVTRATHSLVVTHCGAISEFLETATHTPQLSGIES